MAAQKIETGSTFRSTKFSDIVGSQWRIDECVSSDLFQSCKPMPALNGQCPVCGTIAEAYKEYTIGQSIKPCDPPPKDSYTFCTEPVYSGPDTRLVRCKRCNAAFWQDTEPR
jgi:hypothetical protein